MSNGLYAKYEVYKNGKPVNKPLFILSPETDPVARKALRTYADETDNLELSAELAAWMDSIEELEDINLPGGEKND